MNNKIIEFKEYLNVNTNSKRKLTSVQQLVEFYFWLKKLDKNFEPFDRHVKAAKKIVEWSGNDLDKALALTEYIGTYMTERDLNYTLDTVHRMIPEFETYLKKQKKWQEEDDLYRKNTEDLKKMYGYKKEAKTEVEQLTEAELAAEDAFFNGEDTDYDDDIDF